MSKKQLTVGQRVAKHILPCADANGTICVSIPYHGRTARLPMDNPYSMKELELVRSKVARYIDKMIEKKVSR